MSDNCENIAFIKNIIRIENTIRDFVKEITEADTRLCLADSKY